MRKLPASVLNLPESALRWMREWYQRGRPTAAEDPLLHAAWPFVYVGPKTTCGAKTRSGTPCKRRDLRHGGRCKLHGGLSVGPRTAAGKARSARNGMQPKRRRVRASRV